MVTLAFSPLSKDELEYFVSQFLKEQKINFSEQWRSDLIERLLALDTLTPQQFIDEVHSDKLTELRRSGSRWLRAHTSGYSAERIEDIAQEAFVKWLQYFDAEKGARSTNPEFNYLMHCLYSARADEYDVNRPLISEQNPTDSKELATRHDSDEGRRAKISNFDDLGSRDHERYLSEPFRTHVGEDQVKVGGRYFSTETAVEMYKFQMLAGRTQAPGQKRDRALPDVYMTHRPIRSKILGATRSENVNLTGATRFHRARFQNLKNATTRRWMELALLEMRKSKEKLTSFLKTKAADSSTFKVEEFAGRIPILSAVVLDAHGNLVATCYKGQIDEPNQQEKAWYKHCEFSLFEEVIQSRNMSLVNGGTLFVTLEPCNKRGFYLDGLDKKPKIPCAVRCVEAGIKSVFIGALDFNKKVYRKGLRILETGKYSFDLDELDEGSKSLDRYFSSKGYDHETINRSKIYKIGNPVVVSRFDDDLIEEICEINSFFLHAHEKSAFR